MFISVVFNVSLFLLSYVVPKKEGLFLCGSGNGKTFKGNPKYFYLYIIRNHNVKFKSFWLTENKGIFETLKRYSLPVYYKHSLLGFWQILRAKHIIIEQSAKDFTCLGFIIGNFSIIQTWHGTPLKNINLDSKKDKTNLIKKVFLFLLKKEFRNYKMICSSAVEVSKIFKKVFLNNNVKVTGYPRNDIFFDSKRLFLERDEIFKTSNYFKIVSYIPTFRDTETKHKPFKNLNLRKFNEHLQEQNILFVLKKHPFDKNFPNFKEYSNIKDFSEEIDDVQELLVYTDILITDYSSVFFDFVLTDKPIIYYPYDYEEYLKTCRGMYYDYYSELPGPFAKTEKELYDLIKSVDSWFEKKEYQEKYMRFKNKFNKYQDGNSCERVFKILEEKI